MCCRQGAFEAWLLALQVFAVYPSNLQDLACLLLILSIHLSSFNNTKSLLAASSTLLFLALAIAYLTNSQAISPITAIYAVSICPLLGRWLLRDVVLENLRGESEAFLAKQSFNSLKTPE